MTSARADVATTQASRYLQQLCKHWSHKADADYTKDAGRVIFPDWQLDMTATRDGLEINVETQQAQSLARYCQTVADHLQRFATQETLAFDWH